MLSISETKFQLKTCFVSINYILGTHRVIGVEVNLPLNPILFIRIPYGNLDEAFERLGIGFQSEQAAFVHLIASGEVETGEVSLAIVRLWMISFPCRLLEFLLEDDQVLTVSINEVVSISSIDLVSGGCIALSVMQSCLSTSMTPTPKTSYPRFISPATPDQKRPIQGVFLPDLGRKLGSTAMARNFPVRVFLVRCSLKANQSKVSFSKLLR